MDILIGSDPELFYREKATGLFRSVAQLLPGTKQRPHPVELGAVQVDGMAAEFNTDPAASAAEFVTNVTTVLNQLKEMLPDGELVAQPVAEFGAEYMASVSEAERNLGCDPDFNAYTGLPNEAPDVEATFRTGSGHVHIGFTQDVDPNSPQHLEVCRTITKQMDLFLGIPSLLFDGNVQRRELYGKAGAFRPSPTVLSTVCCQINGWSRRNSSNGCIAPPSRPWKLSWRARAS